LSRIKDSKAKHLVFIPSHPLGYTAGKWREWYPAVLAAEGVAGTVANGLLSKTKGSLTTRVNKCPGQEGWVLQYQRLIKSISWTIRLFDQCVNNKAGQSHKSTRIRREVRRFQVIGLADHC
jgi:hypothetical protein